MSSQELLFSEPTFSETGVWVELSSGIDPAQWAFLCRFIGKLSPREFYQLVSSVRTQIKSQEVKVDQLFEFKDVPLVSIGCSGIGGEYQREMS